MQHDRHYRCHLDFHSVVIRGMQSRQSSSPCLDVRSRAVLISPDLFLAHKRKAALPDGKTAYLAR